MPASSSPPPPPPPPPGFGAPWGGSTPLPSMPPAPALPGQRAGGAVASLVLGIIGVVTCPLLILSVLAIVFGALARKRIKASGGQLGGKGQATAGLVLGIVGLLIGAGFWALAATSENSVSTKNVGDCVEVPEGDGLIFSIKGQDCAEPHEGEIVGIGSLDRAGDDPYPDEADVQQMVGEACTAKFESYVGESLDDSDLQMNFIYPSKQNWNRGDGAYLCIASRPDGELTDSVKG